MTEEQYEKAEALVIHGAIAAGVNMMGPGGIIRYMIDNPLPADFEAQEDERVEAEKQARIVKMRADLAELEKPTR